MNLKLQVILAPYLPTQVHLDFVLLVYLAFYRYSNMFKTFNFHAIIHDAMLFSTLKFEKEKVFQTLFLTEPISNFKIPVKIQSY